MENLRELLKHPAWERYLEFVDQEMEQLFRELFSIDATKPDILGKFIELKSRIDQLRDITYFFERQMRPAEAQVVDDTYGKRFMALLRKIIGAKHG